LISRKNNFDNNFEVFLSDTLEGKKIHYNFRYRVHCVDKEYIDKELFPNQMEFDEWDNYAIHFLVRHKVSGQWIGGMRLVNEANGRFPFEQWSKSHQKTSYSQLAVEISRLGVIKEYRHLNESTRSLIWGMIRAAAMYSLMVNIDNWYFVVAPSLAQVLVKGGLGLEQIGDTFDYRGLLSPYRVKVEDVLANPIWLHDYKNDFRLWSELSDQLIFKI
jgi:N-acyl-L-homoserine lactone synthetase